MRRTAGALLACCSVAHGVPHALAQTVGAGVYEDVVLKPRVVARWQALDITRRSLEAALSEQGWALMAGVEQGAIKALFDTLIGTEIINRGGGLLDGTTVVVDRINLAPGQGSLDVTFGLAAGKGPVNLRLDAEGSVLVAGIEHLTDADGKPIARVTLRLEPSRIAPTAAIASLPVPAKGLWTKLAPELATALLSPKLFERQIDLPAAFVVETGSDETKTETFGVDAVITYDVDMPGSKLVVTGTYGAPVYTDDGIWLLGRLTGEKPEAILPAAAPDLPVDELMEKTATLDGQVEKLLAAAGAPSMDGIYRGVALRLDGDVLRSAVELAGKLPANKRTISVTTTAASGNFVKEDWRDNLLGRGGIRVFPASAGGGKASIAFYLPSVSWATVEGRPEIVLALPVTAAGTFQVGAHVDPLVGGGAGTSVGLEGKANVPVRIFGTPKIVKDSAGRPMAIAVWRSSCDPVTIEATSDGRFKLDSGWTKVPKVGARLTMPASPKVLKPVLVWDARPSMITLPGAERLAESGSLADWELVPAKLAIEYAVLPHAFSLAGEDLIAVADLSLTTVPRSDDPARNQKVLADRTRKVAFDRKTIESATEARIERLANASACTGKSHLAVLAGGAEIGPNNELVKFFNAAWKTVNDIGKTGEKAVQDVGKTGEKALHDAGKTGEKAVQDAGKTGEKALHDAGKTGEKAVQDVGKTGEKALHDTGKALEGIGRAIGGLF